MRFEDIPQRLPRGAYDLYFSLRYLARWIEDQQNDPTRKLLLLPDFQRSRVWRPSQQQAFVECFLSGGYPKEHAISFNKPGWGDPVAPGAYDEFVCVDGLQRLTALTGFFRNRVYAFGRLYREFEGELPRRKIRININTLKTKAEVLRWYLELNTGGTPHTKAEIERVVGLLAAEKQQQSSNQLLTPSSWDNTPKS